MIKNERLDRIIEILNEEKYSSVNHLAKLLYVAPVTIRRDLKKLERDGFVNTCYGGVSLVQDSNHDVPLIIRENFNAAIKSQLAKRAASLIEDGSTVFLDASSTVSYIIDFLKPEQNITIVSNGMNALTRAAKNHIRAYSTGGKLINNSLAFTGTISLRTITDMHADYVFFSSQGLTLDGNVSDQSERETELRQAMIRHSDKHYFMCDHSKIGASFLFRVCNISDLDDVICDKPIEFNI